MAQDGDRSNDGESYLQVVQYLGIDIRELILYVRIIYLESKPY